jgi:hypothetical protein
LQALTTAAQARRALANDVITNLDARGRKLWFFRCANAERSEQPITRFNQRTKLLSSATVIWMTTLGGATKIQTFEPSSSRSRIRAATRVL